MADKSRVNLAENINYFLAQWFLRAGKSTGVLNKFDSVKIRESIGVKKSVLLEQQIPKDVSDIFRELKIENEVAKEPES